MTDQIKGQRIGEILANNLPPEDHVWLEEQLGSILESQNVSGLYLFYSLLGSRIESVEIVLNESKAPLKVYLRKQKVNQLELARIYLLIRVLEADFDYFAPKVAKIIELADRSELITFLKYLVLLPGADFFKDTAVEALRTNITPVFEAISMNNPYPSLYFNEQQWNQMYLKAAFMQLNLGHIVDVEKRSNRELARIISDYAHERWAASRQIDAMIWRPVGPYMNAELLKDMERLSNSDRPEENRAAALCCYHSGDEKAMEYIHAKAPKLVESIKNKELNWNQIKD